MEQVIFLYSKGASTKRKIVQTLLKQEKEMILHCTASLAEHLDISKVAAKKHVDYLDEKGYINKVNPNSKPIFLRLTDKGKETAKKYIFY